MNNVSHVCFECRRVMRRDAYDVGEVPCSSCGTRADYIGDRIPVPPRDNVRAWAAFEEAWREAQEDRVVQRKRERVQARHALEKRIADLESRGGDPKSRAKELQRLRQQLESLVDG